MHKEISQCFSCHPMIESTGESPIACGLSRESEFFAQEIVEEVVRQTHENDYRLRAMLKGFVNHEKLKLR